MRNIFVMMSVLLVLLAGCAGNENDEQEQQAETDAATEERKTEEPEEQVAVNFREVEVTGEEGVARVTGDARATDNTFYYRIEQGDDTLVEETEIVLDETTELGWGEFEIEYPVADEVREAQESPILVLYAKSSSGQEVNPNHIPLSQQIF